MGRTGVVEPSGGGVAGRNGVAGSCGGGVMVGDVTGARGGLFKIGGVMSWSLARRIRSS